MGSLESYQAVVAGAAKELCSAASSLRAMVLRAFRDVFGAAGVGERQWSTVFVAPGCCQVSVALLLPGELWALTSVHTVLRQSLVLVGAGR